MEFQHDETKGRFTVESGHGEARLEYAKAADGVLDYRSTFVPEEDRERGVGEKLVLHALDYAREEDLRVIPTCPFVRHVIEQNPEYRDLVG
ncbi:MAG TPA: GNAT family N-acetyltransferase [Gemmatimonadota bacterium]|nr:GNAT family N-acetyltransferase [Gemmatimonadota bacterium]